MNQEQNNLNPNNFNIQGNNGIPNNQPLNNQNFNQSMSFNQQSINPQPQESPSFQQPINQMNIEQPAPQPLNNTFNNCNTDNQNFDNKIKNNKKTLLIIGIIVVAIIILIIVLLLVFNNNKGNITNNDNNLVYQKDSVNIHAIGENYFAIEQGSSTDGQYSTIIDCDGNIVAETKEENDYFNYISDNYFIEAQGRNIVSNNQKLLQTYEYNNHFYTYKDDVIYYEEKLNNQYFIYAYDLINKKSLWNVNGYSPTILHNDTIVSKFGTNNQIQIISKDGKVIAKETENEKIYPTSVDRYIKLVNNNVVEVYDLNSKLISSFELQPSDSFGDVLSIGAFIVKHNIDNNNYEYRIYNEESKLINTFSFDYKLLNYPYPDYLYLWSSLATDSFNDDKKSIIVSEEYFGDSIILLSNGTIFDNISTVYTQDGAITDIGDIDFPKANFATTQNKEYECLLINFENSKSSVVEDNICTNSILESPNGKYMIGNIHSQSKFQEKFYVYDNNLNLIYQSDGDNLTVYDDNNVIEFNSNDMFLVNVFTGEKTKLNLNGKYSTNNSCGIVTSDKNAKYIYKSK